MGFRRWVSGLFTVESEQEDDTDQGLDLTVDVARRGEAISGHYDLAGEDARRIAEIVDEAVSREDGYTRTMIVDQITREVDIDEGRARTVVDTEVASVRNLARVEQFTADGDEEIRFRWIDSVGTDDSPVCADVRRAIDESGPVTLAELRETIREAASDHESGTPERADDLIPHASCRHTVVRHFETD